VLLYSNVAAIILTHLFFFVNTSLPIFCITASPKGIIQKLISGRVGARLPLVETTWDVFYGISTLVHIIFLLPHISCTLSRPIEVFSTPIFFFCTVGTLSRPIGNLCSFHERTPPV
jgi:hypothetical protein